MATTEKPADLHHYVDFALRRKWYIVVPLVLSMLGSVAVYKMLPKIYKASTLILVQSQRVPENYVRPTVTDSMANQLNTLSEEILSRTRLEQVINEFNLYWKLRGKKPMEEIVEVMRRAIDVQVLNRPQYERAHISFSISYEG